MTSARYMSLASGLELKACALAQQIDAGADHATIQETIRSMQRHLETLALEMTTERLKHIELLRATEREAKLRDLRFRIHQIEREKWLGGEDEY